MEIEKSNTPNYPEDENITRLKEYRGNRWHDIGEADGMALFSDNAFDREVECIEATYNQLCAAIVESQHRRRFEIEIDLFQVGTLNKNAEYIAKQAIEDCKRLASLYSAEGVMEHRFDKTSGCYYIITHYRSGFEAGQVIYIRQNGGRTPVPGRPVSKIKQ